MQQKFKIMNKMMNGFHLKIKHARKRAIYRFSYSTSTTTGSTQTEGNSVDFEEMKRFSKVAQEWWNPSGPYALLQKMNPTRVSYIRDTLAQFNNRNSKENIAAFPFTGLEMLDLGCGGGFLSHSLARLGLVFGSSHKI
jgi:2-polyprenyl-3-methyl-5-hydroxy-6-metoxy-1,4-benzoquinol methylase